MMVPWQAREEVLRLDNAAREYLGLPPRSGDIAQPWAVPAEDNLMLLNLPFPLMSPMPQAN